jgi:hypothetical protein
MLLHAASRHDAFAEMVFARPGVIARHLGEQRSARFQPVMRLYLGVDDSLSEFA